MNKLNLLLAYLESSLHCPITLWKNTTRQWRSIGIENGLPSPTDFLSNSDVSAVTPVFKKQGQTYYCMVPISSTQVLIFGPWKTSNQYGENQNWLDAICLVYNFTHTTPTSRAELLQQAQEDKLKIKLDIKNSQELFADHEHDFIHNPYDEERRELQAITEGNAAKLRAALSETFPGKFATLSTNPLRSFKNLAIVDLALVSRAAIRGGLNYEYSFSLSDSYIRSVDQSVTQNQVANILLTAKFDYQQKVAAIHQHKQQNNPYIYRVENYVTTHLHHKISIKEIADYLGITPKYLSTIFKQSTNQSLKQYINYHKIISSQKELIYTQLPITNIAADYQFSSVSYYASNFKTVTNMTPRQYRHLYQNYKN